MIELTSPSPIRLSSGSAEGGERHPVDVHDGKAADGKQPLRVLVVEDEFFISLDIKALLEALGHVVVAIAVSADEAVTLAALEGPDVVLMDIRLVGPRDGIDAAAEIQSRLGIGIIFVTANMDPETRKRAEAIKPISLLEKPLTEHRLRFGLSRL